MRIVCPSCNAQYEIDISLLPEEGREVQCSACGNIWFQEGTAARKTRLATPTPATPQPAPEPRLEEAQSPPAEPPPAEEAGAAPEDEPPPQDNTADAPPAIRQPKPVDPKVLDILRDEAAFEAEQRAREAGGIETQAEFGLLGAAPWPSKAEPPSDAKAPAPESPKLQSSSSAFPNIDDISASLEPIGRGRNKKNEFEIPATSDEKKSSFLRGLILPLALAMILVALYLAAPAIIEAVPASAPALTGYVNAVDGLRIAIAGLLGG